MNPEGFSRLEVALDMFDAAAEKVKNKAQQYFGITIDDVKKIRVLTVNEPLDNTVQKEFQEIFTDPVTEVSSYGPLLTDDFDFIVYVGDKPGVKNTASDNARKKLQEICSTDKGMHVGYGEIFGFRGKSLTTSDIEKISDELLANDTVQRFQVYSKETWDPTVGVGNQLQEVELTPLPMQVIPYDEITVETLARLSDERNLALADADLPIIVKEFTDPQFIKEREKFGLTGLTDVELETIASRRSDHCNHNTFHGRFAYSDITGESFVISDLFKETIEGPTLAIAQNRNDIKIVLHDNAGVAAIGNGDLYAVTGETHNSPSNMEAYGGAMTGIVGIYRDPMGTGKGSRLRLGMYQYTVGTQKKHRFTAKLDPRRALDGIIDGVRDGGNKSGIPSVGDVIFSDAHLGKLLVHVYALGIMPNTIGDVPSHEKEIKPGYAMIMCGGRVGKDGIHGVTAASESYSEKTPAGHVQIGDPYTQKKMHEFLLEARDLGLISFITDNGGGGLCSSVGESVCFNFDSDKRTRTDGGVIHLDKVPKKYTGLADWEIWISESQERMTIAIDPDDISQFMELSRKHDVESTVIGEYTDSGALHIKSNGQTVGYIRNEFFEEKFPQWLFEARWTPPTERGLFEPDVSVSDYSTLLHRLLEMPNVASKEWIQRQKDHEVQGLMVLKPYIGINRDIPSDAVVLRSRYDSDVGLAVAQALNLDYSKIDAGEMVASSIDLAVRKVLAVGAQYDTITLIDNFCWPSIMESTSRPDHSFRAAQLVRACLALKDMQLALNAPLLSGKDSMYIDGTVTDKETGVSKKLSGTESMLCTAHGVVKDVYKHKTSDAKKAGNLVYVIGTTKDELGGGEFYKSMDIIGHNVPKTVPGEYDDCYRKFQVARDEDILSSVNVVEHLGLFYALAEMCFGGNKGMDIDLGNVAVDESINTAKAGDEYKVLFSESTGRFVVEVRQRDSERFESIMGDYARCIGTVTSDTSLQFRDFEGHSLANEDVMDLKTSWQRTSEGRGYVRPLPEIKQQVLRG